MHTHPQSDPLAYALADLPTIIPLGRTTLQSILKSGALPSRKVGGRVIVLREDVETFLRSLPVQVAA